MDQTMKEIFTSNGCCDIADYIERTKLPDADSYNLSVSEWGRLANLNTQYAVFIAYKLGQARGFRQRARQDRTRKKTATVNCQ